LSAPIDTRHRQTKSQTQLITITSRTSTHRLPMKVKCLGRVAVIPRSRRVCVPHSSFCGTKSRRWHWPVQEVGSSVKQCLGTRPSVSHSSPGPATPSRPAARRVCSVNLGIHFVLPPARPPADRYGRGEQVGRDRCPTWVAPATAPAFCDNK